ncbi:MAG: hypothetical protein RL329_1453 [Bacteroidota bacterium]
MAKTSTFSLNQAYEDFALIFTEVLNGENYRVQFENQRLKFLSEIKKARAEMRKAQKNTEKAEMKAEKAQMEAENQKEKAQKEIEKAQMEAEEKAKKEIERRSQERMNTVLKLYHLKSWTIEQIAEIMELETTLIQSWIQNNLSR